MHITLINYEESSMSYNRYADNNDYTESELELIHGDSEADFEHLARSWATTKGEVTVLFNGRTENQMEYNSAEYFETEAYLDKLSKRMDAFRKEWRISSEAYAAAAKAKEEHNEAAAAKKAYLVKEAADRVTYLALKSRFESN